MKRFTEGGYKYVVANATFEMNASNVALATTYL
jgi:hypothetical protein